MYPNTDNNAEKFTATIEENSQEAMVDSVLTDEEVEKRLILMDNAEQMTYIVEEGLEDPSDSNSDSDESGMGKLFARPTCLL